MTDHDQISEKPVEISARTGKPKRRKAVRACTNCQRTHLTCDNNRPCERCIKRGCADSCCDGVRKRTKRGSFDEKPENSDYPGSVGSLDSIGSTGPPEPVLFNEMLMESMRWEDPQAQRHMAPRLHHLNTSMTYEYQDMSPLDIQSPRDPMCIDSSSRNSQHRDQLPRDILSRPRDPLTRDLPYAMHFPPYQGHNSSSAPSHPSVLKCMSSLYSGCSQGHSTHSGSASDASHISGEYMEPIDSYPLPLPHQRLSNFSTSSGMDDDNELLGIVRERRTPGELGGMAVTNMLGMQRPPQGSIGGISDPDLVLPSPQLRSMSTDGSEGVLDANGFHSFPPSAVPPSSEFDTAKQNSIFGWSEPPLNPLTMAHNDRSRRFSYGYEHIDPSEVYRRVTEPYNHRLKLQDHVKYLKERLDPEDYKRVREVVHSMLAAFGSVSKSMSEEDQLFVEQSFQRSLLEEEKQFALVSVPCLVWRWSGEVAAVSPRFSKLMHQCPRDLKEQTIMHMMTDDSIRNYFEQYRTVVSRGNDFRFDCVLKTADGEVPTETEVTIRRDLFNSPLTLLGKFWVKKQDTVQ